MAWNKVDRPKIKRLTKPFVQEFAALPRICDRRLGEARLKQIMDVLRAGEFRTTEFATCYCKEDRRTYRVNGNHTVTAILKLIESGELNLAEAEIDITFAEYTADKRADVPALGSTFDSSVSSKRAADVYVMYAAADDDLAEIATGILKQIVAGLNQAINSDFESNKLSVTDRAQLPKEHKEFALWVNELLSGGESQKQNMHLCRAPAVAAMYQTMKADPKEAKQFWVWVRDGHPGNNAIIRRLRDYLMRVKVNQGKGAMAGNLKVNSRTMLGESIQAWNAFRAGKDWKFPTKIVEFDTLPVAA